MKMLIRMLRKEGGQALPMALILMFVGVLIIIPVLSLSTTNFKATEQADQRNRDIYAADAGIDDGLWKVGHNDLPDSMLGDWNETTYSQEFNYDMYDYGNPTNIVTVNDRNVNVNIKPIWVLEEFETPGSQGRTPDDRLITYGTLVANGVYNIVIYYDGSLGNLLINRIGCWLPPGFDYVWGSSNLEQGTGQPYHCIPQKISKNGGWEVTWDYAGINYNNLPTSGNRRIVTFNFTPNTKNPVDAFSWIRTNNPTIQLSWDTSRHIFEIESSAPAASDNQTTIVAHSVRRQFQALGGAISGDYQATGNTVMRDHDNEYTNMRERLYKETAATIKSKAEDSTYGIPDDATVEKIFLYWSGWKCKPWLAWHLTQTQLDALPEQKGVNKLAIKVKVGSVTMPVTVITASDKHVMPNGSHDSHDNDQHGWSYACFADITDTVVGYFKDHSVPFYGNATYTVGHWDIGASENSTYHYRLYNWLDSHPNETYTSWTRYPLGSPRDGDQRDSTSPPYYEDYRDQDQWSYSAWSVVVIYSSPSTAGHHLYVFDDFLYCNSNQYLKFTIKGFLAPEDVQYDPTAARMTCFVGEGDSIYTGDKFQIKAHGSETYYDLPNPADGINPTTNVWNSRSNVLGGVQTDDGIDIDTFNVKYPYIMPGDAEATIKIPTGSDVWNLVYIILSFRSEITTGGTIDYTIK